MCRPSGTRHVCFRYPALPCRAIGCSVPAGLAVVQFNEPFDLEAPGGPLALRPRLHFRGKAANRRSLHAIRFCPNEQTVGFRSSRKSVAGEPTADPSTTLLRSSGRDDKERVVAYLGSCDWDVWSSGGRVVAGQEKSGRRASPIVFGPRTLVRT
jgi:hypothetical protein